MITIAGVIVLRPVDTTERSVTVDDAGLSLPVISVRGRTARDSSGARLTLTQALAIRRQMLEIGSNASLRRAVHLDSDEDAIDTGLYELSEVRAAITPATGKTHLVDVSFTARRLGGAGVSGANLTRTAYVAADLQTNSYSITSLPYWALPIGAKSLDTGTTAARTNKDGAQAILSNSSASSYVFSGADYNAGEVKVWDTTGSATESDWLRVFAPDHTFADPAHCVVDNGLVRFRPMTSGSLGLHRIDVWNGTAWIACTDSSGGDGFALNSATVTDAWAGVRIDELSNWRVKVTFLGSRATSPAFYAKSITLDRGKFLALVEATSTTSTNIWLGCGGLSRILTIARSEASDLSVDGGSLTFTAATDNWMATWGATSDTVMAVGACRSSSLTFSRPSTGGFNFRASSATSLAVYLGGVPYDAGKSIQEAEAGLLAGGATTSTALAGYSGTGAARLPNTVGAVVSTTGQNAPPSGTTIRAYCRVAVSSTAAADTMTLRILKASDASVLASVTLTANNATDFPAANTWYWRSVEYASWDGTTGLYPSAIRSTAPSAAAFYVDKVLFVRTIGAVGLAGPDEVAAQAVTETRVWSGVAQVAM